jgi:hypothetical protein
LRPLVNAFAQNRFADVTNVDEIVVVGADIEINVHAPADPCTERNCDSSSSAWRQRSPADVIAARAPGDPGRAPFEIFIATRDPDPATPGKAHPATIMVGSPAEVFV